MGREDRVASGKMLVYAAGRRAKVQNAEAADIVLLFVDLLGSS